RQTAAVELCEWGRYSGQCVARAEALRHLFVAVVLALGERDQLVLAEGEARAFKDRAQGAHAVDALQRLVPRLVERDAKLVCELTPREVVQLRRIGYDPVQVEDYAAQRRASRYLGLGSGSHPDRSSPV